MSVGEGALLSHRSAAALWGLTRSAPTTTEVVVPRGRGPARRRIAVHHARDLRAADRASVDVIPVTAVPRTLLDLAEVASPRTLELAVEAAERLRIIDMRAIRELLERTRGRRGAKLLLSALALEPIGLDTRSGLERRLVEVCRDGGLPMPATNVIVAGFEADAYWPRHRLVVELDSVTYHHTRAAFERDRVRDAALVLAGERVIRVTNRRLAKEPRAIEAELRRLLGAVEAG